MDTTAEGQSQGTHTYTLASKMRYLRTACRAASVRGVGRAVGGVVDEERKVWKTVETTHSPGGESTRWALACGDHRPAVVDEDKVPAFVWTVHHKVERASGLAAA
jgi:hypothetical protein